MDESVIYREHPQLPGYLIGSNGSVWSTRRCARLRRLADKNAPRPTSIYRRPDGSRYCIVQLRAVANGKVRNYYVHRLVLEAFVGPCPPGMLACHNDGNTANNDVGNLRWDTIKNNQADKRKHGTQPLGERAGGAKLKEADIHTIRRLRKAGISQQEIGARLKVAQTTISKILRKLRWSHIP
jgi:hypothetical protein